jgi:hypothetical protein
MPLDSWRLLCFAIWNSISESESESDSSKGGGSIVTSLPLLRAGITPPIYYIRFENRRITYFHMHCDTEESYILER